TALQRPSIRDQKELPFFGHVASDAKIAPASSRNMKYATSVPMMTNTRDSNPFQNAAASNVGASTPPAVALPLHNVATVVQARLARSPMFSAQAAVVRASWRTGDPVSALAGCCFALSACAFSIGPSGVAAASTVALAVADSVVAVVDCFVAGALAPASCASTGAASNT